MNRSFDMAAIRGLGTRLGQQGRAFAERVSGAWRRGLAYLRLMRLHQPVGIWLLLWPTLWALWIAG